MADIQKSDETSESLLNPDDGDTTTEGGGDPKTGTDDGTKSGRDAER